MSRQLWKAMLSVTGRKHKCRLDTVVCEGVEPWFSPFISQTLECVWILKTHTKPQTHIHPLTLFLTLIISSHMWANIARFKKKKKPTNHVVFETTAYGLHSFSGGRNKNELVDWCSIFPFSAECCWVCDCWSAWKQWSKISPRSYMWC